MEAVKTKRIPAEPFSNRSLFIIALIITMILGMVALNAFRAFQASTLPQGTVVISQSALEEKFGLRVSLIAVTASGGMVDVRLKMVDSEKAKTLLQNPKNYPTLFINGVVLNIPEETKAQSINFKPQGNLYLLFANPHNAVQPGTPVTIVFGDTALEPIISK